LFGEINKKELDNVTWDQGSYINIINGTLQIMKILTSWSTLLNLRFSVQLILSLL